MSEVFMVQTTISARLLLATTLSCALALAGCAASDVGSEAAGAGGGGFGGADGTSGGAFMDAGAGGGGAGEAPGADDDSGEPPLPPENEKEVDFGAPEGSPNFVFIPVRESDTVVRISGSTLDVALVEVGDRPTVLRAVPGLDAAVVMNAGSDDVSIITSSEAEDTVAFVPVLPHCNAIAVDPSGKVAIAWYDHERAAADDPVGSFQAVSVVRLDEAQDEALTVSVGFRPSQVEFVGDGSRALIVTDDGVSILELGSVQDGDIVVPVPVSPDPLDKPTEREVQITPDATWAIIRASNVTGLRAVHLDSQTIVDIPMSVTPTDLDLLPDGSAALAVLREDAAVAIVDLPSALTDTLVAETISTGGLIAGLARLTDDGSTALLYTSVEGIEQVASLDLNTRKIKPVLLRKTVDFVVLPEGSRRAILVHKAAPGPGYNDDATEAFVDDSFGYTLYDLDTGFTKLVLTPFAIGEIATAAPPTDAWLLLADPAGVEHSVEHVSLQSFLTSRIALGSEPEHARFLELAGKVAITQDHPSGRVTFIDADDGTAKTVTGYELNGLVK